MWMILAYLPLMRKRCLPTSLQNWTHHSTTHSNTSSSFSPTVTHHSTSQDFSSIALVSLGVKDFWRFWVCEALVDQIHDHPSTTCLFTIRGAHLRFYVPSVLRAHVIVATLSTTTTFGCLPSQCFLCTVGPLQKFSGPAGIPITVAAPHAASGP